LEREDFVACRDQIVKFKDMVVGTAKRQGDAF